ncbi:hypothetical protein GCM10009837_19990 [Streptomyces durmitorensis]|uniref:Transposase n=1 Tax=Streptomyces durmitorensis TaxID=319947 RepID=A0ABY4PPJ1_9ACTN|nr:hypothetical protein [Streptomyces durmitorensis]UQT55342.1 hypothetical protein M4V62_09660 [Streptomyces durmitorensis]
MRGYIKTLANEAAVDRTAFYGTRPYARLRAEFERRLQALQDTGEITDPREAQITRLKTENTKLKERLTRSEQMIDELADFRGRPGPARRPARRRSSDSANPPGQVASAASRRHEPP